MTNWTSLRVCATGAVGNLSVLRLAFKDAEIAAGGKTAMIEIAFEGVSAAEASELARKARASFLREGAAADDVVLARDNDAAMDAGSVLQFASMIWESGVEHAVHALTAIHCAQLLWEVCRPARAGLRIKGPDGLSVVIPVGDMEYERILDILATVGKSATKS